MQVQAPRRKMSTKTHTICRNDSIYRSDGFPRDRSSVRMVYSAAVCSYSRRCPCHARAPYHIFPCSKNHRYFGGYPSRHGAESHTDRTVRTCPASAVYRSPCHAFRRASRPWLVVGIVHDRSDYTCDRMEASC